MSVGLPDKASMKVDTLFTLPTEEKDFCFDKNVVDVFDDMIHRSVPFYSAVQAAMVDLAVDLAKEGRRIYDVGCSVGSVALAIARQLHSDCSIVGIDNSPEMIHAAQERARDCGLAGRISYKISDVTSQADFADACVAIFSLTLQFIRPPKRLPLLKTVYDSLNEGGALIVFEKVAFMDTDINRRFISKYYDFKRSNRYTDIEIAQKRISLENVLIPFTIEENVEMFREAGFKSVATFFQWYNFAAFVARK